MTHGEENSLCGRASVGDFGAFGRLKDSKASHKLFNLSSHHRIFSEGPKLLAIILDLDNIPDDHTGELLVRAELEWSTGKGTSRAVCDVPVEGALITVVAGDGLQVTARREGTSDAEGVIVQGQVGIASSASALAQRTQAQALPFASRVRIPRYARDVQTFISSGNLVGDEIRFWADRTAAAPLVETAAPEEQPIKIPNGALFWDMVIGGQPGGRIVRAVWGLSL